MEENVALDPSKQKKFVKSIKGIKKLIKKNQEKPEQDKTNAPDKKDGKIKKRKRKERGLVYLAHIPHGFYEHEMTQYFKQFGMVTNVRVIRSKRTGNSKGYAFIEFKEPTVAQIVAETMNNYLMGKRLLKAAYIPPEKQRRHAMRKRWNPIHNPSNEERLKQKKAYNADKSETEELKTAQKILSNISKTKAKLSELGINYDFFTPVDIPEQLLSETEIKNENEIVGLADNKKVPKIKKPKKEIAKVEDIGNKVEVSKKKSKQQKEEVKKETSVKGENIGNKDVASKKRKQQKEISKSNVVKDSLIKDKKSKVEVKVDKKQQKQKEQKLKDAGIESADQFIKIQDIYDDSDSSLEFDSDEYEKLINNDEESLSSGNDDSDDDGSENDSEEEVDQSESESEEELPPKAKNKNIPSNKKDVQKSKKQDKNLQQVKRKAPQAPVATTKKPKFEKQKGPLLAKKQFKKKK